MIVNNIEIFDFKKDASLNNWTVTNDDVMGGISTSQIFIDEKGNGVFSGKVSLENNGGFAMTRLFTDIRLHKNSKKIKLKVKGDGKKYQFRIKSDRYQRYWYIQSFQTSNNWQIIELNLTDFYASFRGNRLNLPNFSSNQIKEIAILIGNKKEEQFHLNIDYIKVIE